MYGRRLSRQQVVNIYFVSINFLSCILFFLPFVFFSKALMVIKKSNVKEAFPFEPIDLNYDSFDHSFSSNTFFPVSEFQGLR